MQLVTDYTTKGTNPLAFTRSYNSLSYMRNLLPTMMGADWRNNYDRYLLIVLNGTNTMAAAQRAGRPGAELLLRHRHHLHAGYGCRCVSLTCSGIAPGR